MGWSGLIGDWTTFTLALLIMAQDPTLLQILPPLLVILALCLLPWRGGASLGMNKVDHACSVSAPASIRDRDQGARPKTVGPHRGLEIEGKKIG